ncbi:MAG: (d)CMP kinase [Christensenellaceae bacterium]|nr:(d)CMP kinase [Christensenellaceae bacterium]MBR3842627.1 (d)CMP kinase [Christensenellaceae bacterium]
MRINIAIDGPAGTGKSTIAKRVSSELGIKYMDTGAMYRGIAYALLQKGIDVNEHEKVLAALPETSISVEYGETGQYIVYEGENINAYLRTPETTKASSDVAVIPEVRAKLVAIQQETAKRYDIVMDGRDIGTVVLPDAPLKIFMTASPRVRAERRYLELKNAGKEADIDVLEKEIAARDKTDSTRAASPLKQAEDAVLLDTTSMGIEEVVAFVMKLVKERFEI